MRKRPDWSAVLQIMQPGLKQSGAGPSRQVTIVAYPTIINPMHDEDNN